MKTRVFLSLLLALLFTVSYSQKLEWAYAFGSKNTDLIGNFSTDSEANLYITGTAADSVNFNPKNPNSPVISRAPDQNFFLAKYDKDFNHQWLISFGYSGVDQGFKVKISDSSVYVIGAVSQDCDIDPSLDSAGIQKGSFLARYSASGKFISAKNIPPCNANSELFLLEDRIIVFTNYSLQYYDKELNLISVTVVPGKPVLMPNNKFYCISEFWSPYYNDKSIKEVELSIYDINLSLVKSRKFAKNSLSMLSGGMLTALPNGQFNISGSACSTLDFYGANDTVTIVPGTWGWYPGGQYPVRTEFSANVDTLENIIWAKAFRKKYSPFPNLVVGTEANKIFTFGFFNFDVNFDPDGSMYLHNGGVGCYVAEYQEGLNYSNMAEFMGGSYHDEIVNFQISADTAIMCGNFMNTIDLDLTGKKQLYTVNFSNMNFFIARYSGFDITSNGVSIGETMSETGLKIFPNPANESFSVSGLTEPGLVMLMDNQGKEQMNWESDPLNSTFSLQNVSAGFYQLLFKSGTKHISLGKLVKTD